MAIAGKGKTAVVASGAKQSTNAGRPTPMDCFAARAMTSLRSDLSGFPRRSTAKGLTGSRPDARDRGSRFSKGRA